MVITIGAFLLTVATAVCCAMAAPRWITLGLWLISRACDGLDGAVAREHDKQNDLGGYVDMLLDVVGYTIIPTALALCIGGMAWPALAVLLGVFYINATSWMYLSALFEKRGAQLAQPARKTAIVMPAGLIEGTETVILYALFIALPQWIVPMFLGMAALTLIGSVGRVSWAIAHLNGRR